MSQDTGLFSVRRPRETLGGINFNSNIPQPASALKRASSIGIPQPQFTGTVGRSTSGSRMSLAPGRPNQPIFSRSSSGGNLAADLGMSAVKRSSSQMFQNIGGGRKSYAPPSVTQTPAQQQAQRRSSVYSRPSGAVGPFAHQSFFQSGPVPAGVPRDPRPLKDRSYQARLGQELMDYLTQYNFEMEMKHSLTHNTMKSPTQKDFNYMFQWLYHRIDPSYRFQKNIDQEVPPILKQLRYPFEKSITKSQIAAVGGQNWSTFLGLLHWMMQLAQMLERYDMGVYDDACAEAGVDISGDRIIFRFLSGAYHDWLQVGEDDDDEDADRLLVPHVEAMAAEFDNSNSKYLEELAVLEAENKNLLEQIEEMERSAPDIAKLDKHFKILETDKGKFEQYNASMEAKAEKYESRIKLLSDELEKAELELQQAEEEKAGLHAAVDRQGITTQDIDRMNSERERLQKGVENAAIRLEEAKAKAAEREYEAVRRLDELERVVEKYNSLAYQVGIVPSSAPNAKGENYELSLTINDGPNFSSSPTGGSSHGVSDGDRLLADATTGYQPHQLLNLDLRGAVRSNLGSLKKDISDRRNVALEQDLNNHDLLDKIKETIDDKRSEVEALEHRVRAAEEEFEKTKEVTTTQKLASDAQIEKMEKELAKMRAILSESIQLMEQREMNTNIEYEQLTLRANSLREELHTETERLLNDVIKFKVHVQKSLEDFEGFVAEEVEAELGAEEDNYTYANTNPDGYRDADADPNAYGLDDDDDVFGGGGDAQPTAGAGGDDDDNDDNDENEDLAAAATAAYEYSRAGYDPDEEGY
ncbi:HEC/Ndc80p family protein [Xylona heveae TC161]|uniref:Probable kinetochore protein NDC80 n=1 Tax=Xylona heveae (strain CBS 132557 / TC161) TaxID=1328760 RepID=A0A165GR93_XYLHT|nr:HEC/Ndc80p family protein [Xylona heveae TC161]KZF22494.1 HEC/Ndc80p family protein [Xylona heveae TC161]